MNSIFVLFETIKVENGFVFNLPYHQRRLDRSYKAIFKKECPFNLRKIISIPSIFSKGTYKLRFLYNSEKYKLELLPYKRRIIKSLKIVDGKEVDYAFKFLDRKPLNMLYSLKGKHDDILIIKNGYITDTSIANIMFFDGNKWFTPSTPLLKGTCRENMLKHGKIFEDEIKLDDLYKFKSFCLINAMNCDRLLPVDINNIF